MKRIWTKEQIQKEIEGMDAYLPVSKIEERLGMPPTTLQKVLSGKRELPKKWVNVLESYFVAKLPTKIVTLNNYQKVLDETPKEVKKYVSDHMDQLDNEDILKQIKAIEAEKIPYTRDTPLGRKVWNAEKKKRIQELQSKLK